MQDGYPTLEEIYNAVEEFIGAHSGIARLLPTGRSEEGRPVPAVMVTDPSAADEDKEAVLIVCGRHGNELGTRTAGLGIMRYLGGESAELIRRREMVVVVPVANPDGCVREEFHAPGDGLSPTVRAALVPLAEELRPDAVVDIHSLANSDMEAVIIASTSSGGVDEDIHRVLAEAMCEAACRERFLFSVESVAGGNYNNFFSGWCYEEFHSVVFGMEVNHAALSPEEAGASACAAVGGLLAAGTGRFPGERHPGFPNRIAAGDEWLSVRASGKTAAARRASRILLWRAALKGRCEVRRRFAGESVTCRVEFPVDAPLPAALCCRVRTGGGGIKGVSVSGRAVEWEAVEGPCWTNVFVDVTLCGGEPVEVEITLEKGQP